MDIYSLTDIRPASPLKEPIETQLREILSHFLKRRKVRKRFYEAPLASVPLNNIHLVPWVFDD